MKGAATDVSQWQNFNQTSVDNLIDDCLADQSPQGVKDCLSPWRHLLAFTAWQISKLLSADGIERAEDDNLLMEALFHHRFKACT